jgi:uncharacterized protein YnzC (UPF0291/DUF896 family)
MLSKEKLDRLNELANKKKTVGLSADEQAEQQVLREEYLKKFRESFRQRLENIDITWK